MPPKVKGICFACHKEVIMELKALEKYKGNDKEYYICPECNAGNSTMRKYNEISKG